MSDASIAAITKALAGLKQDMRESAERLDALESRVAAIPELIKDLAKHWEIANPKGAT